MIDVLELFNAVHALGFFLGEDEAAESLSELLAARSMSHTTEAWAIPIDLAGLLVESTLLAGLLFQVLRRSGGSTVFRLWYGSIRGSFANVVYSIGCSGSNLSCVVLCVGLDLSLESVALRCYCIEGGKSLGLNLCLWRRMSNIWLVLVPVIAPLRTKCAYKIAPRRKHCSCYNSRPKHRPMSISQPSSSSFVTLRVEVRC